MTALYNWRPWLLIRWGYRRLRSAMSSAVDLALGVDTTYDDPTGVLEADDPELTISMPSGWLTLVSICRALDVGPEDVMVDYGSGTGRAILVASLFPFRRVVGIERRTALHERALANVASLRLRRRAEVELIAGDARNYRLPDDVTVVFFYNPFDGEVFRSVVEGTFASYDRAPRRMRIVCHNPKEHDYLEATGRCRLYKTLRGLRPGRAWSRTKTTHFYEIVPATAAPRPRTG